MPSTTIPFLSYTAAVLVTLYLVLVATTVYMAAWQTNLAVQIHETESELSRLESRYYDVIATIDRTDPAAFGLTKPAAVTYATTASAPTMTLR